MVNILLIQPNYDLDNPKQIASTPIAIVELATFLNSNGHKSIILDRNIYYDDAKLNTILSEFKPEIIGVSCYTSPMIKDVLYLSRFIKRNTSSLFIVGGIHATLEPKSLLDIPEISYIVRGEGEETLLEICNLVDQNKIEDIKNIKNVNYNELRSLIDLKTLPIPDYDLLEINKYPLVSFFTSRGCMGRCRFCYNRGRKLRFYDTDKMISLMNHVIDKYNIKEFSIADDNFATRGERTKKICEALSKHKIIFHCCLRADQACDEVMKNLKMAGCWSILFGFESGSQRVLDYLNKDTKVEQNIKAIKIAKKYGIYSSPSFMIGIPTETESEMLETINFIEKNKPDTVNIGYFKPFPATELYDECFKKNKIKQPNKLEDWINFNDTYSSEPNVSEIPTEKLVWAINKFTNQSYILYLKKFIRMISSGHSSYAWFKFKCIIKNKFNI